MDMNDALLMLTGATVLNQRLRRIELRQSEGHALLSARIRLNWTPSLPVNADLSAEFLPLSSYGCSFLDSTVDSSGAVPIITTRWRLNEPLAFDRRAQMMGSNLIDQGGTLIPIVGVIVFPTSVQQDDPSICQVANVVNNLMTPGTSTVFEVHVNIRRGDVVGGRP